MARLRVVWLALLTMGAMPATAQQLAVPSIGDTVTGRLVRVSRAWPVMGTLFVATVWTRDSIDAAAALRSAHDSVRLVDSLFGPHPPEGEILLGKQQAG